MKASHSWRRLLSAHLSSEEKAQADRSADQRGLVLGLRIVGSYGWQQRRWCRGWSMAKELFPPVARWTRSDRPKAGGHLYRGRPEYGWHQGAGYGSAGYPHARAITPKTLPARCAVTSVRLSQKLINQAPRGSRAMRGSVATIWCKWIGTRETTGLYPYWGRKGRLGSGESSSQRRGMCSRTSGTGPTTTRANLRIPCGHRGQDETLPTRSCTTDACCETGVQHNEGDLTRAYRGRRSEGHGRQNYPLWSMTEKER